MCAARTHAVSVFQTTSAKSPPPMAAHRLTSVTFNGKELVRYDYDGYGDLTAVYGRDGKNCAALPTATTSWSNIVSPTDWYPATNTTVTTPTAKCLKAATTSAKNGRSTTAKTIPSLPTHWGERKCTVSWMKLGVMNKSQADKYMRKQLIRLGGKVFGKYGSHSKKMLT